MRAELHDGTVLEFPDGTDPAVIQSTVKKLLAERQGGEPAQAMSKGERFAQGMADPIHGGAQWLTKALPEGLVDAGNRANNWLADKTGLVGRLPPGGVDQQVRERESQYQAARGDSGVDWMRLLGNVASPVNVGIAAGAPGAATLLGRMGSGAAVGGLSSVLSPVTGQGGYGEEKLKQVTMGTLAGGAVPAIASGLGRVISPKASVNPELQMLKKENVRTTLGQSLGGRWNAAEEKATSIPILGDAISRARARSLSDFNEAAINRATAPIGAKVSGTGQDAVAEAGNALSGAYNAGKAALGHFQLDQQGVTELNTLRQMTNSLPMKERRAFGDVWKYLKQEVSKNGSITADGFKRIDSKIGKEASRFSGSQDAYQQQVGDALNELKRVITENAKRANPQAAAALKQADEGWANLVRVEGASKAAKNSGGVFTPGQLNTAIQTADRSARKRAVSRGEALMQDLGRAGQNVIGNKVPNSFTTDRALLAGGGLGAYMIDPSIPAALLGGASIYSPLGQALLRGAVSSRPQQAKAVADALKQASPMLGPGSGLLTLELME
jgi:hypothetical protein